MAKDERNAARNNQLLGALASASRERIDPHLEPIRLKLQIPGIADRCSD
jgi:hypothetical protein